MSKVKIEILRGTVISAKVSGVEGEIAEVGEDEARNLYQAGAAKPAEEGAKVGKPKKAK